MALAGVVIGAEVSIDEAAAVGWNVPLVLCSDSDDVVEYSRGCCGSELVVPLDIDLSRVISVESVNCS